VCRPGVPLSVNVRGNLHWLAEVLMGDNSQENLELPSSCHSRVPNGELRSNSFLQMSCTIVLHVTSTPSFSVRGFGVGVFGGHRGTSTIVRCMSEPGTAGGSAFFGKFIR
jgi:hypothetical protein